MLPSSRSGTSEGHAGHSPVSTSRQWTGKHDLQPGTALSTAGVVHSGCTAA